MAAILEQRNESIHEVFHHVGTFGKAPAHGQASLLSKVGMRRFQVLIDFGGQITRHVGRGEVADGTKSETSNEPIVAVEIVLERVGGKHENVRLLG